MAVVIREYPLQQVLNQTVRTGSSQVLVLGVRIGAGAGLLWCQVDDAVPAAGEEILIRVKAIQNGQALPFMSGDYLGSMWDGTKHFHIFALAYRDGEL